MLVRLLHGSNKFKANISTSDYSDVEQLIICSGCWYMSVVASPRRTTAADALLGRDRLA